MSEGRLPIDLNLEPPYEVVNRMIAGRELLTDYDVHDVMAFNADFVIDMFDENDQPILVIDWEFFFFYAKMQEVKHLMNQLYNKAAMEKALKPDKKIDIIQMAQLSDEVKKNLKR